MSFICLTCTPPSPLRCTPNSSVHSGLTLIQNRMSKVWLRFERKKKDGTVMKLKIQDLPAERTEEAADLMVKYFTKDEPYRRAVGFANNPKALREYKMYITAVLNDPCSRNVMCCADTDEREQAPPIMGISSIAEVSASYWDMTAGIGTDEANLIDKIWADASYGFDLMKKFNLTSYYAGKSLLVLPEYRGNGIAEKFFTVRRLMCAAHGVAMTGAWMSSVGSQIAAERDGWETLYEVEYEEMSRKYGLLFEDVPRTEKYMAARPHPEYYVSKTSVYGRSGMQDPVP